MSAADCPGVPNWLRGPSPDVREPEWSDRGAGSRALAALADVVRDLADLARAVEAAYLVPEGGIPAADLAAAVRASLARADSALQSLPAHTHQQSDVSGLSDALAGKAPSTHTHQQSDVAGLVTALNGKAGTADATLTKRSGFSNWVLSPSTYNGHTITLRDDYSPTSWDLFADGEIIGSINKSDEDAVSLVFRAGSDWYGEVDLVATREALTGYVLGSQTDKPLAGVGDIPSVPVKAVKRNGTALTPDAQGAVDVSVPIIDNTLSEAGTAADAKATGDALAGKAPSTHTHAQSDVSGLQAALNGKVSTTGATMTGPLEMQVAGHTKYYITDNAFLGDVTSPYTNLTQAMERGDEYVTIAFSGTFYFEDYDDSTGEYVQHQAEVDTEVTIPTNGWGANIELDGIEFGVSLYGYDGSYELAFYSENAYFSLYFSDEYEAIENVRDSYGPVATEDDVQLIAQEKIDEASSNILSQASTSAQSIVNTHNTSATAHSDIRTAMASTASIVRGISGKPATPTDGAYIDANPIGAVLFRTGTTSDANNYSPSIPIRFKSSSLSFYIITYRPTTSVTPLKYVTSSYNVSTYTRTLFDLPTKADAQTLTSSTGTDFYVGFIVVTFPNSTAKVLKKWITRAGSSSIDYEVAEF